MSSHVTHTSNHQIINVCMFLDWLTSGIFLLHKIRGAQKKKNTIFCPNDVSDQFVLHKIWEEGLQKKLMLKKNCIIDDFLKF